MVAVNACVNGRIGPPEQDRAWPVYLGSPARVSPLVDSVAVEPQPVWRNVVARGVIGTPALAEDVLALAQADGQAALLERATGDVLWRRRLGGTPAAGPLLSDDRVIIATQGYGGTLFALHMSDGREFWNVAVGDVSAPPALDGGVVYVATVQGWVFAIDASSGHQAWRVRLSGAIRCAPVPVGGGIVVATSSDSLYLLDRRTGSPRLRRQSPGAVLAEAALAQGRLLVGTSAGDVVALDTADLAPVWRRELGSPIVGALAVLGGKAYALTARGTLWTIPLTAPDSATSADLGIVSRAGPAPVPGGVFVVSVDGFLTRVDATGARRWTAKLRAPVVEPVTPDGTMLFAVSEKGEVVAFR